MGSEVTKGSPVLELQRLGDVSVPGDNLQRLGAPARRRALRFAGSKDREEFIAGRIAAQRYAASLLEVDPTRLTPAYDCPQCGPGQDHGRPGFMLDGGPAPLVLSASRASGWVLLAAVVRPPCGTLLGVDLESVSAAAYKGFDDVALTPRERDAVIRLPAAERNTGRARLWARKEAWLKMTGEGLRRDPAGLDVLDRNGLSDLVLPAGMEGLVAALALSHAPEGVREGAEALPRRAMAAGGLPG
ncbi:4'-phosphopantetheinyl transferase family protein [Paenarthrobacter sp. NCHU4564]|uniref:4'-phosphopantetheinyl transferase family protein n=1 Tax=Paenarthrobacter sp. NCHU4564 TaxID=3451353 RepID=UPI003F94D03B